MDSVEVYEDSDALMRSAAERFVAIAAAATMASGRFSVGLSGGNTPRPLYELLARDDFARRVDWAHTFIFWGDERCVPPTHPDSNYQLANESLLQHVDVPAGNIHRIRGELEPAAAAAEYEAVLQDFFGNIPGLSPRFDLLLLGLGADGHTASLFPHSAALQEDERWVVANRVAKLNTSRVTLTAPAINAAAHVVFLVAGADKQRILREVWHGPFQPEAYPAQLIAPAGEICWMVDAAAVAGLELT